MCRAGWQSGHAADCKSVYAGSIPTPASNISSKNKHLRLSVASILLLWSNKMLLKALDSDKND